MEIMLPLLQNQCIVGIDIVSLDIPKLESAIEYVENFSSYFTSFEFQNIVGMSTSEQILSEFYRYWCLKEAYVKATGAGFGYGLNRIEFHHTNWTDIHVLVDGKKSDEWQFKITQLSKNCWISVAKGHPREAVTSYKKTLTQIEFGMEEHRHALMLPDKEFDMLCVEDLIPEDKRGAYYALFN